MSLTNKDLLEMYRFMLLTRRFTEQVMQWHRQSRVLEALHPSAGQEAVGVGVCYGLRPDDVILPSLRTREVYMVRGVSLKEQLATMCARATGTSGGRDTSHHSGHPQRGILSGTATVGAQIPWLTGAALALKYRKTDNVAVGFFGDGASGTGNFHEGINLAAVLKVPAVFICENNLYAQFTAARDAVPIKDIAIRAAGYGIPGETVDGQDILAVHEAVQRAVARARAGQGPSLIECKTYRYGEHCPGLDAKRTPQEIAAWRERDPIKILGDILLQKGIADAAHMEEMDQEIRKELQEAIEYAEASPLPQPGDAIKYVYAPVGGKA